MMTKERVEAMLKAVNGEYPLKEGGRVLQTYSVELAATCLALYEREERLRKALEPFAVDVASALLDGDYYYIKCRVFHARNARSALKEDEETSPKSPDTSPDP